VVKAIIFDCFGVLALSSYEPFKKKYFGDDQEMIDKFMVVEDRSSRGEITLEEAEKEFAELANISPEQCAKELENTPRNEELLDYIADDLKRRYKIGFLSNVAKDRTPEIFSLDDVELFDDIVLSFQVGMAKPDIRIFKLAAERLGLDPEKCVFVDDVEKYLEGARRIGMKTVHYADFGSFKEELEKLIQNSI
jgi:epoxide hydrolase-like predicted phosphatase